MFYNDKTTVSVNSLVEIVCFWITKRILLFNQDTFHNVVKYIRYHSEPVSGHFYPLLVDVKNVVPFIHLDTKTRENGAHAEKYRELYNC